MSMIDDAKEFIKLYYLISTSKPLDLPKFYDEMALVSRPSFEHPIPFGECTKSLNIASYADSNININSTVILPNNDYIAIMVTGSIKSNDNERLFTQTFILQDKADRLYITSEAFQFVERYNSLNNYVESVDEQKGDHFLS